jgi:WD40 repeat protein
MVFKLDRTIVVKDTTAHSYQADYVTSVAVSGNRIVSIHKTSKPKVWDVGTGELVRTLNADYIPDLLAIASDRIVIGEKMSNLIEIWNARTGDLERSIDFFKLGNYDDNKLSSIAITSNGKRIVCGIDKDMMALNADTGETIRKVNAGSRITSVAIDKYPIFGRGYQEDAVIWTNIDPFYYLLEGHTKFVTSVATSGDLVVTGSRDQTVKVWNAKTQTLIHTLEGHKNTVFTVAIAGNIVVSSSLDDTVKMWNADTGALIQTLKVKRISSTTSLAFDGTRIVIGGPDNNIQVWSDVQATVYAMLATTKQKNNEYGKSVLDKTAPKDDDIAFRLLESNAVEAEIEASESHLRKLEEDKEKTEDHLREFELIKSGTSAFRYDRFIFTKPPDPPHGLKLKPSLYLGLSEEVQNEILSNLTGTKVKKGGRRTKRKRLQYRRTRKSL